MTFERSVQDFINRVRYLHEPDFGDFKRKVGLYLSSLQQELKTSPEAVRVIRHLQDKVIYNPNGNVEATRRLVLSAATQLLAKPQGIVA